MSFTQAGECPRVYLPPHRRSFLGRPTASPPPTATAAAVSPTACATPTAAEPLRRGAEASADEAGGADARVCFAAELPADPTIPARGVPVTVVDAVILAKASVPQRRRVSLRGVALLQGLYGRLAYAAKACGDVAHVWLDTAVEGDPVGTCRAVVLFKERKDADRFRRAVADGRMGQQFGGKLEASIGTVRFCPHKLKMGRCRVADCSYEHPSEPVPVDQL
eukprot:TRINITY_DN3158_c2_g1_i1.p1 TRINITY_DN3158_c2_g1~~TRINITY_DN3158_c2_g1_i1.p1  ORF type:complete len:221 (+),score=14.75 TRINITY_DN3158_c2_g1_i1:183-845(+)